MKALVTGSTGFVGSHLVEELLREGFDVTCLLRPASRAGSIEHLPVTTRTASLHDPAALADAVDGMDYLFHVAGLTRARTAAEYRRANTDTTIHLLTAAQRRGASLQRFVYVSSLAAAGPTPGTTPLDEDAAPRPIGNYGASKLAAEQAVFEQADRMPVTVVRPPVVYGSRDPNTIVMFKTAQRLRIIPVIGSPTNRISMVHVSDLARGIRLAATTPAGGGRGYFISGGDHSVGDIAAGIAAALRLKVRAVPVSPFIARLIGEWGELVWSVTGRPQLISRRKIQHALQPRWTCSAARAEREMGYRPEVQLAEGLARTARWYADQGWIRPLPQR